MILTLWLAVSAMKSLVQLSALVSAFAILQCTQPVGSAECCGLLCGSSKCTKARPVVILPSFNCRDQTCCETGLNNRYGTLKADSLTLDLTYPNRNSGPTLTAKWAYDTVPQGNVKVFISVHDREVYCFHPNNAITTVTLTRLPDPLSRQYSCRGYDVKVQVILYNNTYGFLSKTIFVGDCWSVMGNRSLDVCGVQVPSPPVNVSALLSVDSSTNVSTLTVEWSPPLYHNTPIEKYYIELQTDKRWVSEGGLISPSKTKYSVTDRENTVVRNVASVRMAAGVNLKTWECKLCCTVETSSTITYHFKRHLPTISVSSVTITPSQPVMSSSALEVFPTSSPTTQNSTTIWVVVGAVIIGLCFVVIVCLVGIVFMLFAVTLKKKPCRDSSYFSLVQHEEGEEQDSTFPDIESIFIVASTEEDEGMQYKLRYLVHDLADNGIDSVYYEYERTSHGPESPATLGIFQWVELQFQKCDLVLFAFTKKFLEEWKRESTDQLSPVVWSSRHVLDGLLPHQGNISKFGVVLMGEDCTIPPGLKRFQVFRLFNGDSPTIHSEHLIRYILETPPYAPPRVSTA